MSPDNYDKECVARRLITDLFKAKATGCIQVLLMDCALSVKQLDPQFYRMFLKHAKLISDAPLTSEPPKSLSVADINVGAVYDATHAVGEALKSLTKNERVLVLSECLANEAKEAIQ